MKINFTFLNKFVYFWDINRYVWFNILIGYLLFKN